MPKQKKRRQEKPKGLHALTTEKVLAHVAETEMKLQMLCLGDMKNKKRERIEREIKATIASQAAITRKLLPPLRKMNGVSNFTLVENTFRFVKCLAEGRFGCG